ncbi:MAG: glutamate synthase large subunit [Gemmataceae bacterium]|nr:glutamate synthase large subunit [Gemmataceae bacterium]
MASQTRISPLPPIPQGLYHPSLEKDACGVGFIANIHGQKSHSIIQNGLQILFNLQHRGACGCDQDTGDGAGILIQIPDRYFREILSAQGIKLPKEKHYGVAFAFLTKEEPLRLQCEKVFENNLEHYGLKILAWRDVPVDSDSIGWLARSQEPLMRQAFIALDKNPGKGDLETLLYLARRRTETWVETQTKPGEKAPLYFASCSTRTVVYKGMLKPDQLPKYFKDLGQPLMESALAVIHSRYSTNTFPQWSLAQPFRFLAHNGEINTLQGNIHWLKARSSMMKSPKFGKDIDKVVPLPDKGLSDSAILDQGLELLIQAGRALPHAITMMVPEAYEGQPEMDPRKRAYYQYHSCLMEPWDGPASLCFSDGTLVGGMLDRNGLRPSRYVIYSDGTVVLASESGVLPIPIDRIVEKGRLQPGRIFLVDTAAGKIIPDHAVKDTLAKQAPYLEWLEQNHLTIDSLPEAPTDDQVRDFTPLIQRQQAFGFTQEDINRILLPMAKDGKEPVSSMGTDIPLAVLSNRSQLLFHYFKQLFAQVTNPPIDALREEVVMSTETLVGSEVNLLDESPLHARLLRLETPTITGPELERIRRCTLPGFESQTIKTLFKRSEGEAGLKKAMDRIREEAVKAVKKGVSIVILSDRGVDQDQVPIPSLLATAGVHHDLLKKGLRGKCGILVETGEAREVMHFALLVGYGASAVLPYLVFETFEGLNRENMMVDNNGAPLSLGSAIKNYIKSIDQGMMKIFSKMGISTLLSYRAAQIFEAIGLGQEVTEEFFTGTPSRISGIGLDLIAKESLQRHALGFPQESGSEGNELDPGGEYMWRRRGEYHMWNPETIQSLQHAVNQKEYSTYKEFSDLCNEDQANLCTIRGLLEIKKANRPIPLELVESAKDIVKRFCTGAMSFGSISKEAHETLAIAMNRIGGRSNTGEGGEDPARFKKDANGDSRNSAIKQVASGRFGVTSNYLVNALDLQIKIAQGAKPGEGGQLPGHKVDNFIAKTRYSTPGVGLISPPPHHDIYSIEDLAQLIFDLKNANPHAEVSVKLVAEVGVGTIAAGVAKGFADRVLISGDSGGTGASPLSSIRHAGIPWELGLAETQQTLVRNGLRGRVRLQTDGQIKTGRDVVIAACLGAEEYGFSTAPLIAMGCIMMRKCHLNTCPVGIATQDPYLRAQFQGTPEQVINYLFFVAEEVRENLSAMGYRSLDEIVGRMDLLKQRTVDHWKGKHVDLSAMLEIPKAATGMPIRCIEKQPDRIAEQIDWELIKICNPAIERGERVQHEMPIFNSNRTVGTLLSYFVTAKHGEPGLPEDCIDLQFNGSAGQSFGAFVTKGLTLRVRGDANDYIGKGLSGGKIVVAPPAEARFIPEDNILIGNVALYGATGGEAFFRGMAGERFAVRNSGAKTVVEGVGDHGCEYMTGGVVVVLGKTGRNFAAGMSGGLAFVYDVEGDFRENCNLEMVDLVPIVDYKDIATISNLVNRHVLYTGSTVANGIVNDFSTALSHFKKVFPKDYRRVLEQKRVAQRQWELVNG